MSTKIATTGGNIRNIEWSRGASDKGRPIRHAPDRAVKKAHSKIAKKFAGMFKKLAE